MRSSVILQGTPTPKHLLGADCLACWDAARTDLLTVSGTMLVSNWRDTVNGYDVSQFTTASKPVFQPNGFNGDPCIAFDGIANQMTYAAQPFPQGINGSEIWVVCDQTALAADATTRVAVAYGTTTGNERYVGRLPITGTNRARAVGGTGGAAINVSDQTVDLSGRHIERAIFESTGVSIQPDGGTITKQATTMGGTEITRVRFGARGVTTPLLFWQGSIALVVVTNRLSAGKAAALLTLAQRRVRA